jgi:long-chain fatty acid transport protein
MRPTSTWSRSLIVRAATAGTAAVAAATLVALVTLVPVAGRGAGLELREQGAAAISLSDAVTARFDHPSTVYFNPAGMAFLEGLQVSAGITLVFPQFTYRDPDGEFPSASNTNAVVPPPHLYASWRINEMWAVGLSLNVPFGLGIDWPDDFAGRHISQGSAMNVFLINPNVAIRPIENLSIAVGIQLMPGTVEIRRTFGFVSAGGALEEGGVQLGGVGFGVGGNLGIMYRPLDWLYLGYFYRSRVQMEFEGDAHFTVPDSVRDRSVFHDQPVKASATLPDYMTFGIGFQVAEDWYIETDLDVTIWSTVDSIDIEFPEDASGQLSESVREDWVTTVTPRLGVEWTALRGDHTLKVRFGGGYDMVPAPNHTLSPLLPDSQRIYGSAGLGWTWERVGLGLDLGFMYSQFLDRTVGEDDCKGGHCNPFPAHYQNHAYLLGIDLNYRAF